MLPPPLTNPDVSDLSILTKSTLTAHSLSQKHLDSRVSDNVSRIEPFNEDGQDRRAEKILGASSAPF